jgi:hypothetical protein
MNIQTLKQVVVQQIRRFGPYVALELIMPGGTLLAAVLWWSRHSHEGDSK